MTIGQTFLDYLLGYRDIFSNGVLQVRRKAINFGSGLTVTDNPVTGNTDVDATGGVGGGSDIPPYKQLQVDTVATPASTRDGSYDSPYNLIGSALSPANSRSIQVSSSLSSEDVVCTHGKFAINGLVDANTVLAPQINSLTCSGLIDDGYCASISNMVVLADLSGSGTGGSGQVNLKGTLVVGNVNLTAENCQFTILDGAIGGTCTAPSAQIYRSGVGGTVTCAGSVTLENATCNTVDAPTIFARMSTFATVLDATDRLEALACAITFQAGSVVPTSTANLKIDEPTRRKTWGQTSHLLQVSLSSDQTDYLATGTNSMEFQGTDVLEVTCTGAVNLRSLASVRHLGLAHTKIVRNSPSSSGNLTLSHNYTSGTTAALRFSCAGAVDLVLAPGEFAIIDYSTASAVWYATSIASKAYVDSQGRTVYTATPSAGTVTTIATFAIPDETVVEIVVSVTCRDTGNNLFSAYHSQKWYRAGGGSATLLQSNDPVQVSNISGMGTSASSLVGSGNNVLLKIDPGSATVRYRAAKYDDTYGLAHA